MSQVQATLLLDPQRRSSQETFLSERVRIIHSVGETLWVSMNDDQVSILTAQGIDVQLHPEADWIELPAISFRAATETPVPPSNLTSQEPTGDNTAYYLIHFTAPVDRSWIHEISGIGAIFLENVNYNAGIFKCSSSQATEIRTLEYIDFAGLYHPAYALSYLLCGREEPFTASTLVDLSPLAPEIAGEQGNLLVTFFADVNPDDMTSLFVQAGAQVVQNTGYGLVIIAQTAALPAIASIHGVYNIESYLRPQPDNNRAGIIGGIDQVRRVGVDNFLINLDGAGEIVGVMDDGLDGGTVGLMHADIAGRVLSVNHLLAPANPVPDLDWHGTHVVGTIAGDGTRSGGAIRGAAPAAHVIFHGPLAGDFLQAGNQAYAQGARVHHNSWGQGTSTNCRYEIGIADVIDRWCFMHPDSLVVFTSGNSERDQLPAPNGNGTLDCNGMRHNATAKNVLAVGATESTRNDAGWMPNYRVFFGNIFNNTAFDASAGAPTNFSISDNADEVALFSNRGQVRTHGGILTGRIKPDIVAPGTNILSLRSRHTPPPTPAPPDPNAGWMDVPAAMFPNANDYGLMHGTSMAAPLVSGCALLVRQFYRTRFDQLRRPLCLQIVRTGTPVFTGFPTISSHQAGALAVWLAPAPAADPKNINGMRLSNSLVPVDTNPVQLVNNAGSHPAPKLVCIGNRTYLLHRHSDNKLQLRLLRDDLTPDTAFNTTGIVILDPASAMEDTKTPDIIATTTDQLAVVWPANGANPLYFQRFNAQTGAPVDNAAVSANLFTQVGPHNYLAWDGNNFMVAGVYLDGGIYHLQVRRIAASNGAPIDSSPLDIRSQAQVIRETTLVWNSRISRYALAWVDCRSAAGGEIYMMILPAAPAAPATEINPLAIPAGATVRYPRIIPHNDIGYVLVWEENSQNGTFDVYFTLLGDNGLPDTRIAQSASDPLNRRLIRISDSPNDTSGFAVFSSPHGTSICWQGNDEINSDGLGIFALNLTPEGAFESQNDPNVPLIKSGRYVNHELAFSDHSGDGSVSMVAAGGIYYFLRFLPSAGLSITPVIIRTNSDGVPDNSYGVGGTRNLNAMLPTHVELFWSESRMVAAIASILDVSVWLFNDNGDPVNSFGTAGIVTMPDIFTDISLVPQIGSVAGPFRIVTVYGIRRGANRHLRYCVMRENGTFVTAPRDLVQIDGTATRGWFHFIGGENLGIATWSRVNGTGASEIWVCCYNLAGNAVHGGPRMISGAGGQSFAAVIAPRPTDINSNNREYGVAWQFRPDPAAPAGPAQLSEIRFSRLTRTGTVNATASNVLVISSLTPGFPAATDAIEPQLVSTFLHYQLAAAGINDYDPGYGLAFIGLPQAGGDRALYFTILNENGGRAPVPQPPPAASAAAEVIRISNTGASVGDFKIVWNGCVFHLTWTERQGDRIRHMHSVVNRSGNLRAYDVPSASLIRATLINGATNIDRRSPPTIENNQGYGWGRLNLRQSIAPVAPVTMYIRDSEAVGRGRTASYRFTLPHNTVLLRITLNWTDPPGPRIINNLHLRVTAPAPAAAAARPVYHGNLWRTDAGHLHESKPVEPGDGFENIHTFKQIVIENPASGVYDIEVICGMFPSNAYNQQNVQPFSLVFVGSGEEARHPGTGGPAAAPGPLPFY